MGKLPPTRRSLTGEIRKDRENVRAQRNGSPFFGTGFHPTGNNGIESDDFDGDLDTGDAGSRGWAFNSIRAAIGELFLRPGSLTNDSLASPVATAVAHADASDFTLSPGASVAKATATVVVPTGYTRAMVTATAAVSAFNPNTAYDYLFCAALIQDDTTRGYELPVTVNPSESGIAMHTATALLTGLSGSFTVKAACSTSSLDWLTSVSGNVANIDASIVFLR